MKFHSALKVIRESLQFKSAKKFFEHLERRSGVDFNYSYYVRMENGKTLPSSKVVTQISAALPTKKHSEFLVLAYCQSLFPKSDYLFENQLPNPDTGKISTSKSGTPLEKRKTLSVKQVAALAKSKTHYYIFLLTTLSRKDLKKDNLENYFPLPQLDAALNDLQDEKIVSLEGDLIHPMATEMAFPKELPGLDEFYQKMDIWDQEMAEQFNFENCQDKMFLRRVSPRYVELIQNHVELLFGLIRSSDELDAVHNQEVVSFQLKFQKGKLPG